MEEWMNNGCSGGVYMLTHKKDGTFCTASSNESIYFTRFNKQRELSRGQLTESKFWLLIELSTIHSDKIIRALRDYLVGGETRKVVCERYSVSNGYLSTSLSRIYRVNHIVTQLVPYYINKPIEN
ncbi:adhesin biosynthesis transcription regulatory family protein [Escherichia coli]|uniref:adhesin biosynthesis transcription regulatory family protein n=1 Tax=Escherichia coli TaxID=562 RepID=UPI00201E04A7|nr:adhesin biosynthesis transcription regulatory family protein [Escherichia coli]